MNCSNKKLFKNFWVADGSGAPLQKVQVLTSGDKILALEKDLSESAADEVIRGNSGLILAPGFIDAHGHSDLSLPAAPEAWSKITQGVTCEVGGNCGLSAFPLTAENRAHLNELYRNYGLELDWSDYQSYQKMVQSHTPAMRFFSQVGHNTLRAAVAGYEKEALSRAELDEMKNLLHCALNQGAVGLSFGLLYVPGEFATAGEITELMQVVAEFNLPCTAHLRSEGNKLLEALQEMFDCAQRAGLQHFHISHLKTAGPANWHKLPQVWELIDRARAAGLKITFDRYPYIASSTQLSVVLPAPWDQLDDVAVQKKLQNPEEQRQLLQALSAAKTPDYWHRATLISAPGTKWAKFAGQSFSALPVPAPEAVVDILSDNAPGALAAFSGLSANNLAEIIASPSCVGCSDGNALPADLRFGSTHPRAFGAIARFVRQRLDANAGIPEAVRQVTGATAEIFQLSRLGILRPGNYADLTVFSPEEINSEADFITPNRPASGIKLVMQGNNIKYRN